MFNVHETNICSSCYNALNDDLFIPKEWFYIGSNDIPIIFNSGCSVLVDPFEEDFVQPITPVKISEVVGEGIVKRIFRYYYWLTQHIFIKGYIIHMCYVVLFSSQSYFDQEKKGSYNMPAYGCSFTFTSSKNLTFNYTAYSKLHIAMSKQKKLSSRFLSAISSEKLSISKSQEEILLWYGILGYYNIQYNQKVITIQDVDI